jgi:hypothetical protein
VGLPRMPKFASTVQYGPLALGGAESAAKGVPRLLHVDEEVALEDILPFLVLLGLLVRLVLLVNPTTGIREQNGNGAE